MPIPPLKEDLNGDTTTQGKFKNAIGDLWDWVSKKADKSDVLSLLSVNMTVTVGSNGDFATINEALAELSKFYPLYKKNGYTAVIKLLSGFVIEEQVFIEGIDLGWITIEGEDEETTIRRDSLTVQNTLGVYPAFSAQRNATLPIINQLFYMNTDDSGHNDKTCGISLTLNSKAFVAGNAGVKNVVDGWGLYCSSSNIIADNTIFTDNNINMQIAKGSNVSLNNANLQNAGQDGLLLSSGIANCRSINCSNSKRFGIYAISSTVDAYLATATNTDNYSIYSINNSNVFAYGTNCSANGNTSDIEYAVNNGGILTITAPAGGSNTNIAVNTIDAHGIIFKG